MSETWSFEQSHDGGGNPLAEWIITDDSADEESPNLYIAIVHSEKRASLIAAAPELYDALQTALHSIDNLVDKGDAFTKGLAALARARGEGAL